MQTADPAPDIKVHDDPEAVARAAARRFVQLAAEAVADHGAFSVALAGGSTPKRIYELLATDDEFEDKVDWRDAHVFFGDERTVPHDHADSNFRMAHEALLSRVPLPAENVHPMKGTGDAAANASLYEDDLRSFFGGEEWPRFDLVMLGMGDDGHTASLFPSTAALERSARVGRLQLGREVRHLAHHADRARHQPRAPRPLHRHGRGEDRPAAGSALRRARPGAPALAVDTARRRDARMVRR